MPAFVRDTDPWEPQRKRRESQDLPYVVLPFQLTSTTKQSGDQCDPLWGSVTQVTPGRAMPRVISKAEILLSSCL